MTSATEGAGASGGTGYADESFSRNVERCSGLTRMYVQPRTRRERKMSIARVIVVTGVRAQGPLCGTDILVSHARVSAGILARRTHARELRRASPGSGGKNATVAV